MSDRFLAEVLDEACGQWFAARTHGEPRPHELRVSPVVYDSIAEAKANELARGNPLLVLGLDLVKVDGMPPTTVELS